MPLFCFSFLVQILKSILREEEKVRIKVPSEPGEPDNVCLLSPGLSAGCEWVSDEPGWAGADSSVISSLTFSILPAGPVTGRSAVIVVAGSVQGTFTVVYTFS